MLTAVLGTLLDAGKSASGLKEVAESFQEGMTEGTTGVSSDADFGAKAVKPAEADAAVAEKPKAE